MGDNMLLNSSDFLNWLTVVLVLILVICLCVYLYQITKKNRQLPVERVKVRVTEIASHTVGNAMVMQQSRNVNLGMMKERFTVSFRADNGVEYKFILDEPVAGKLFNDECGILTFQGNHFISFEKIN